MRTCTLCSESKPVTDFYRGHTRCKECTKRRQRERYANDPEFKAKHAAYQTAWQKSNRERATAITKAWQRRNPAAYKGLTNEEFEALVKKHGGLCAICGEPETMVHKQTGKVRRLSIDHDHGCCPGTRTCGKCVRGLLCYSCNRFLSPVLDKPGRLEEVSRYLAEYRLRRASDG